MKGLGPAKRAEIAAIMELARRSLAEALKERPVFDAPAKVKDYLRLQLGTRPHEVFAVAFLDAQNRLLTLEELFRGSLTQTSVYTRDVVKRALDVHAAAVILAVDALSRTTPGSGIFRADALPAGVDLIPDPACGCSSAMGLAEHP